MNLNFCLRKMFSSNQNCGLWYFFSCRPQEYKLIRFYTSIEMRRFKGTHSLGRKKKSDRKLITMFYSWGEAIGENWRKEFLHQQPEFSACIPHLPWSLEKEPSHLAKLRDRGSGDVFVFASLRIQPRASDRLGAGQVSSVTLAFCLWESFSVRWWAVWRSRQQNGSRLSGKLSCSTLSTRSSASPAVHL